MSTDYFANFLVKYEEAKSRMKIKATDEIEPFNTYPLNIQTLAMVVLMLVHNKQKKISPNIDNIAGYDLEQLNVKLFEPYIKAIRESPENKKEKKASAGVTLEQRHAKFVATFICYLAFLKKSGIKVARTGT